VIFLTLKDVKHDKKEDCFVDIFSLIQKIFIDHKYLLDSDLLSEEEKVYYQKITSKTANSVEYSSSFKYLSEYLSRYHKTNTVILIDEYDTPIQAAFHYNFYEDIFIFMRNFLSGALKDNKFLEKAVLTGILRVSKESLFSGLNNIKIYSILEEKAADKFGFTESEVKQILDDFDYSAKLDDIRALYDGYNFGGYEIYNPWSIIHCVEDRKLGYHWANSSDNGLIRELCLKSGESVKRDFEILIESGSIKKPIDDNIVYGELNNKDVLWSFIGNQGIIFEFKTVDTKKRQTFESVMERAKKQIIEKKYTQELKSQGVTEIVNIIAVFEGKEVRLESF
jgi:hypothetical protein